MRLSRVSLAGLCVLSSCGRPRWTSGEPPAVPHRRRARPARRHRPRQQAAAGDRADRLRLHRAGRRGRDADSGVHSRGARAARVQPRPSGPATSPRTRSRTRQRKRTVGSSSSSWIVRSRLNSQPSARGRSRSARCQSLGPNDLAAVISTRNGAVQGPAVQNLTADRPRLLRAINAIDPSTAFSEEAVAIMNRIPGSRWSRSTNRAASAASAFMRQSPASRRRWQRSSGGKRSCSSSAAT